MKKLLTVILVLCFLARPVMGMSFTDAGKKAAGKTNAELGLTQDTEEINLIKGRLDLVDMKLTALKSGIRINSIERKMDKTESLVLFFVKAGLCLWGFNNGTTYGYVTGVIFGIGAAKDIGTAVYE